jgi:hypothetical protein
VKFVTILNTETHHRLRRSRLDTHTGSICTRSRVFGSSPFRNKYRPAQRTPSTDSSLRGSPCGTRKCGYGWDWRCFGRTPSSGCWFGIGWTLHSLRTAFQALEKKQNLGHQNFDIRNVYSPGKHLAPSWLKIWLTAHRQTPWHLEFVAIHSSCSEHRSPSWMSWMQSSRLVFGWVLNGQLQTPDWHKVPSPTQLWLSRQNSPISGNNHLKFIYFGSCDSRRIQIKKMTSQIYDKKSNFKPPSWIYS